MDECREREIAVGLREGKPEAWHALYDEYARPIWLMVARRLGPQHDEVADVVQEIMFSAARGARQFDIERGSLWMWLSGIARNSIALYFRKHKRHVQFKPGNDGEAMAAQLAPWLENRHPDPVVALESSELAGRVRATLTGLPHDYESLLAAKYFDDVSVEQLAHSEKSTPVAIRSKLARARQAFRDLFLKTSGCSFGNKEGVR